MINKSSTFISGVLAVGIYIAFILVLVFYFNTRDVKKPTHFVKKNEDRIRVSVASPKDKPKKQVKKKSVEKKLTPKKKSVKKETVKKKKTVKKKVIKEKVVKKPHLLKFFEAYRGRRTNEGTAGNCRKGSTYSGGISIFANVIGS